MAAASYVVDDRGAAVRFYTGRLGFSEGRSFAPASLADRRDLEVSLSAPGSSGRGQDGASAGGSDRIALFVPDLDAAMEGLPTRGPRVDGPAGSRQVVEDPRRNPIELFHPK